VTAPDAAAILLHGPSVLVSIATAALAPMALRIAGTGGRLPHGALDTLFAAIALGALVRRAPHVLPAPPRRSAGLIGSRSGTVAGREDPQ
jgi:hypothetical protein